MNMHNSMYITSKNQHISEKNLNLLISVILAIDYFTASALDVASSLLG
jgi:hypothetical protein